MAKRQRKTTEETAETPGDAGEPAAATATDFPHGANEPQPPGPVVAEAVAEAPAPKDGGGQEKKWVPQPDPYQGQTVPMTDEKDGPCARLWRNEGRVARGRPEPAMAITFDEKPAAAVLEVLRQAGFEWEGAPVKAWELPIDLNERRRTVLHAERTFKAVANMARQAGGFAPMGQGIDW